MNFWQRILARVRPDKPNAERIWIWNRTQAGQDVNEDVALRHAAVWACVNVIAKAIAILPWCVYEKTRTGRREKSEHPVNWLLHHQPNPEMVPYQFKHLLATHVLTWGNAYCEIERDVSGRPLWLWPITPDRVTPQRNESGAIVYRVKNTGGPDSVIEAANVLHIRGMGFDGLIGYSPIRMAAESIGLGMAMEQFGASFFGNGAAPSLVLEHPKTLGPTAIKNLEDSVQRRVGGKNTGRPFVAEEGMKVVKWSIPPNEAQFLESRKHQVTEICRWYGVPPHKIADLGRATWNNIESQGIEFVTDTIQPWVTQFEEETNLKLFGRVNRGVLYTKFNLAALLRGDMKTRYEAYEIGHRNGWLCANDIRALEDLNPITNGGMYVMQAQMVTREHVKSGAALKQKPENDAPPSNPEERMTDALCDARVLNRVRTK